MHVNARLARLRRLFERLRRMVGIEPVDVAVFSTWIFAGSVGE